MAVLTDLLDRASAVQTADGYEVSRVFLVDQLSGDPSTRLASALQAPGLPRLGDAHPTLPDARVAQVDAAPALDSPSKAIVRVLYRVLTQDEIARLDPTAAGWILEWGGQAIDGTTTVDWAGAPLMDRTRYRYSTVDATGGLVRTASRVAEVSTRWYSFAVTRYTPTLTAARRDTTWRVVDLLPYVGSINEGQWNGSQPHTWLCTGVLGSDGGRVSMTFARAPLDPLTTDDTVIGGSWDRRGVSYYSLTADDTGELAEGANVFQLYPARSWDPLGIRF